MKQADLGLNLSTKRTRKREFLYEMNHVVPWADLEMLIAPYAPEGKRGRPPFAVDAMLCIHFLQQKFGLSDPANNCAKEAGNWRPAAEKLDSAVRGFRVLKLDSTHLHTEKHTVCAGSTSAAC